jgi:hypothetical protein
MTLARFWRNIEKMAFILGILRAIYGNQLTPGSALSEEKSGAPGAIRTPDPQIRSPILCESLWVTIQGHANDNGFCSGGSLA